MVNPFHKKVHEEIKRCRPRTNGRKGKPLQAQGMLNSQNLFATARHCIICCGFALCFVSDSGPHAKLLSLSCHSNTNQLDRAWRISNTVIVPNLFLSGWRYYVAPLRWYNSSKTFEVVKCNQSVQCCSYTDAEWVCAFRQFLCHLILWTTLFSARKRLRWIRDGQYTITYI